MVPILLLLMTILVYLISKKVYAVKKKIWLSPLLVSPVFLIVLLLISKIPYHTYEIGAGKLSYLLGTSTVAFAVPIYKHSALLKKHALKLFASLASGSLFALVTSGMIAWMIQLQPNMILSLLPRSITTPIAMELSNTIGGNPSLTAVFVIITGLIGSTLGPVIIRWAKVKAPISHGMMLGMGAHGTGTSKAFELGELEGTFSSLSMIVGALITIVFMQLSLPWVDWMLGITK